MMTPEQTHELLEAISRYDNRRVDAKAIRVWHEAARRANWHIADALNAVHAHFAATKDTLYPIDITHRIRAARDLPQLPSKGSDKRALSAHADPNCGLCDEYGWVNDSEDKYGWAIRCRHDPHQIFSRRPDNPHEAANQIRAGRALEAENPGYYRRAHDVPDPSEPRTRGRP